jgi:hypothetical protein
MRKAFINEIAVAEKENGICEVCSILCQGKEPTALG